MQSFSQLGDRYKATYSTRASLLELCLQDSDSWAGAFSFLQTLGEDLSKSIIFFLYIAAYRLKESYREAAGCFVRGRQQHLYRPETLNQPSATSKQNIQHQSIPHPQPPHSTNKYPTMPPIPESHNSLPCASPLSSPHPPLPPPR